MMLRIITNIPLTEDSDKIFSGNLLSFQLVSQFYDRLIYNLSDNQLFPLCGRTGMAHISFRIGNRLLQGGALYEGSDAITSYFGKLLSCTVEVKPVESRTHEKIVFPFFSGDNDRPGQCYGLFQG